MGIESIGRRFVRMLAGVAKSPAADAVSDEARRVGAGATDADVGRLHAWLIGDGQRAGDGSSRSRIALAMAAIHTSRRAVDNPERVMGVTITSLVLLGGVRKDLPREFEVFAARVVTAGPPSGGP